ncbi:MAG: hypothetical protein V3S14_16390, partial [Anaerolineae bacterium]
MYLGSSTSSGPQSARPGMGRRASIHRRLVWSITLALGGLAAVGVVVVAQDANPDWDDWGGTEPVNITQDALAVRAWQPSSVAAPPNRMMVAWSDVESEGVRNIYTVRSNDNGRTWSASQIVSSTAYHSSLPDALIAEDRYFVAWVDLLTEGGETSALYEAEIAENGNIVAVRPIPIPSPLQAVPISTRPRLAASEGQLHVVFNAGDPSSILYATRALTATQWPTATVVTSTAIFGSWFPSLAVDP